jgi:hypothetical protein
MPRKRRNPRKNTLKPGVSGARYRKDAAFKNSRRAATDFGHAAQCAVLLRQELMSMLEGMRQNEMHKKLTRVIGVLIREKRLSGTQRVRLNDLPWERFEGWHFNEEAGLGTLLSDTTRVEVNAAAGKILLTHPSFRIANKIKSSRSITHVRIIAGVTAINFDRKTSSHDYGATDYLPCDLPAETPISLTLELPAPVIHPVFVVFGLLSFKQERDKRFYEMPGRRQRALNIIYVQPAPLPVYKTKPRPAEKPPGIAKAKTVKKKKPSPPKAARKKRKP